MAFRASDIANLIGKHVLKQNNARVVCPPGRITPVDRRNIIVATGRRSGTHVAIDILLNSCPDYRRTPLYVDLDRALERDRDAVNLLKGRSGYVIKTHYPVGARQNSENDALVREIAANAHVIMVNRDIAEIATSLSRWKDYFKGGANDYETIYSQIEADSRAFQAFWEPLAHQTLNFRDLFDPEAARQMAEQSQEGGAVRLRMPSKSKNEIMIQKALTRALGKLAPTINTTLHTMK